MNVDYEKTMYDTQNLSYHYILKIVKITYMINQ